MLKSILFFAKIQFVTKNINMPSNCKVTKTKRLQFVICKFLIGSSHFHNVTIRPNYFSFCHILPYIPYFLIIYRIKNVMTFCKGTLINNISDVTHILHFAFRFSSDTYDRKLIFWYIWDAHGIFWDVRPCFRHVRP